MAKRDDSPFEDVPPIELRPPADPRKTLVKAVMILVLFPIAVSGMCYMGWMLWHLPPKP